MRNAIEKNKFIKKSCTELLTSLLHSATINLQKEGGKILINTNKIKGRMAELQITQKDVATSLGLAQPTVNQKINNIRPMDLNEAEKLSDLLNIKPEDFAIYFFYNDSCVVQK